MNKDRLGGGAGLKCILCVEEWMFVFFSCWILSLIFLMFVYCSVTADAKYVCFVCVIMLCGYGKRGTHRIPIRYMHMGAMDPPHIILILRLLLWDILWDIYIHRKSTIMRQWIVHTLIIDLAYLYFVGHITIFTYDTKHFWQIVCYYRYLDCESI